MRPFDARLLRAVPAARRSLITLAVLGIAAGAGNVATAFALAHLVTAVVTGADLTGSAVFLAAVLLGRGLVAGAQEWAAARAAAAVSTGLRRARLADWADRPREQRPDEAQAVQVALDGADDVEPYVARYLPSLVAAAVVPVFSVVALAFTDWLSALIVVLTLPLLPLFAALIGQHTAARTQARQSESVALAGHFLDVVRGLPTLAAYQRADRQADQVRAVGDRHRRATVRTLRTAFLSSAAMELMTTICVAMVAVAVGLRLAGGQLGLTVGLTAILLAPEAYLPIRRVGQEFHAAADGADALDRLLGREPAPPTRPIADERGGPRLQAIHVGYRHPSGNPGAAPDADSGTLEAPHPDLTLDDVSLDAPVGLTCIVGPSGVGKTTLLELLAGERTPTTGAVVGPRAHLVSQRPFLAPATVAENLVLSADAPSLTAVDPIAGVPVDAVLGDDGVGLSAGQRAAVALARARRSGAAVVLVDEPSAHLDPEAARTQREALVRLARDRVVVAVTHDEDLIARADQVVRLEPRPATHRPTTTAAATRVAYPSVDTTDPSATPEPTDSAAGGESDAARDTGRGHLWRPSRGIVGAGVLAGLASASAVALTAASGWLIVRASERPIILTLMLAIVMVRLFGVTRPVLRYAERVVGHDAALADLVRRRTAAYRALVPLTPARLGRRRRADLLTGFVRDLDDEVDAQVRVVVPVLGALTATLVAAVLATALLPGAGAVIAATGLVGALLAALCAGLEARGQRRRLAARGEVARATHLLTGNAAGLRAVDGIDWALGRLDRAHDSAAASVVPGVRGRMLGATAFLALSAASTVAMAAVVVSAVRADRLEGPVAALLALIPVALGEVLATLPDAMSAAVRARAARRRVDDLLDQEPAVADDGTVPLERPLPELGTDGVAAAWQDDAPRIPVPDLQVRPGSHVAITGPNGAGKSTLVALLARHLDPVAGRLDADGVDVRSLCGDDLRRRIAVVDDEPHVFSGTLAANLRLARPGADDAALTSAIEDAGLGEFLRRSPKGLQTDLGASGNPLSGGERARLAVARALLSERPVLLLDEPVAHLDRPLATAVLRDVHARTADRSVVIVTHQSVGVDGCDSHVPWDVGPACTGGIAGNRASSDRRSA